MGEACAPACVCAANAGAAAKPPPAAFGRSPSAARARLADSSIPASGRESALSSESGVAVGVDGAGGALKPPRFILIFAYRMIKD